jgi:hypothetical protein
MGSRNRTFDGVARHPARRPALSRLDRQAIPAKEFNGVANERVVDTRRQRGQPRWCDGTRIAIERSNQKRHVVTEGEFDVLAHLRVLRKP